MTPPSDGSLAAQTVKPKVSIIAACRGKRLAFCFIGRQTVKHEYPVALRSGAV